MRRRSILAFTLIELLTVIAITAILLTIIVVPVVQSFNLTRQAQAFAEAQDRARLLSQRISRELEDSVGPRDLSTYVTAVYNGNSTLVPASSLMVDVPEVNTDGSVMANAPTVQAILPYAKLDIIEPSQGQTLGPGQYVDPRTGFVDPTLNGPKGQITLPVASGSTMVRYWIGLHNPLNPDGLHANKYNEPYTGLLMALDGERDNLFVLYRAEVQPYVYRTPANNPAGAKAFRPNLAFFQSDAATDTQIVDEDDPNFFNFIPGVDLQADGVTLTATGQAKAIRIANWKKAAILQSDITRYDMVFPIYDKGSRKVKNVGGVPELISLSQFRPTRVSSEMIAGETATRLGQESASGASVSPDVFMTQLGLLSNPTIRTYPIGWNPTDNNSNDTDAWYEIGRRDQALQANVIFAVFNGTLDDSTFGAPLFNLDLYDQAVNTGALYPFSQAVAPYVSNLNPVTRSLFVPYTINRKSGKIITSFNISQVGNPSIPPTVANPYNLPSATTTGGVIYTPTTDTTVGVGVWSDAAFASINERFNKIWTDFPSLRPNIQRFIDLRVTPNADGTPSPLYPDPIPGQVTGLGQVVMPASGGSYVAYSRVSIVPGTEVVMGPDELPGVNFGNAIRYTRVTQNPGPNQYTINYTDLPQPTDQAGNLDYALAFTGAANPLATYSATDFSTAILQPRFKAGYIQLCSDPNVPLPIGNIMVSYRFQVSGKATGELASVLAAQNQSTQDTFSVDYDSRQLMDVLITVRNYPQTTLNPNPQTVTLKSTASVRNFQR